MDLQHRYTLAEEFHSIQGEGLYTGVPMHFIRLSGCNVGVFSKPEALRKDGFPELAAVREATPQHSVCTSVFGGKFICDTWYNRVIARKTALDLLSDTYEQHVCITGGEPFLHDLEPLMFTAAEIGIKVHIETSGTLVFPDSVLQYQPWITCSPKAGYRSDNDADVNEFKFIVTLYHGLEDTISRLRVFVDRVKEKLKSAPLVYIQPANDVTSIDSDVLGLCKAIQQKLPEARLSVQLHKILRVP